MLSFAFEILTLLCLSASYKLASIATLDEIPAVGLDGFSCHNGILAITGLLAICVDSIAFRGFREMGGHNG